jgi:hypothetical protein
MREKNQAKPLFIDFLAHFGLTKNMLGQIMPACHAFVLAFVWEIGKREILPNFFTKNLILKRH